MSILKTTIVVPHAANEIADRDVAEDELHQLSVFGTTNLDPAKVLWLINRLENYLALIEIRKRNIEEMKRKYQNAE